MTHPADESRFATTLSRRILFGAWLLAAIGASATFLNRRESLVDRLTATPSPAAIGRTVPSQR